MNITTHKLHRDEVRNFLLNSICKSKINPSPLKDISDPLINLYSEMYHNPNFTTKDNFDDLHLDFMYLIDLVNTYLLNIPVLTKENSMNLSDKINSLKTPEFKDFSHNFFISFKIKL